MRLSKLFAIVLSGSCGVLAASAAGCGGGDDGTGGGGGGGTTSKATCEATCEDAKDVGSECLAIVDNKDAGTYGLRMAQLTIEKPSVLANKTISNIIDAAVTLNLDDCKLTGDGTFSWILEFDSATGKLKTGGAKPVKDPTQGYCFVNESLAGTQVSPIVVDAAPNESGKFDVGVGGNAVVPIFLAADASSFILLPLRNAKIINATLSADRNCIGKYNSDKLDPELLCEPAGDVTRYTSGASLDGHITLEEADAVDIATLGRSLCALLTGQSGAKCERDGNGDIIAKGDWCSTTDAAADGACADAFKLGATFAASAVKVNGDCK